MICDDLTWFVTWTRNNALTKTASAWPSLKYSLSVVLNFFEYFTNSFFRCSTACFPDVPGMKPTTSFTASSSFLMALAISLFERWFSSVKIQGQVHNQLTLLFPKRSCGQRSHRVCDLECASVRPTSCWVLGMHLHFYLIDIQSLLIFRFVVFVGSMPYPWWGVCVVEDVRRRN